MKPLTHVGHQVLDAFVRIGGHTYDRAQVYQLRGIIKCLTVIDKDRQRRARDNGVLGPQLTHDWLYGKMLAIEPLADLIEVARHDKSLQESGLVRFVPREIDEPLPLFTPDMERQKVRRLIAKSKTKRKR